MAEYPLQGQIPWDDPLKNYLDDRETVVKNAAVGQVVEDITDPESDTGAALSASYVRVFTPEMYGTTGTSDDSAFLQEAIDDAYDTLFTGGGVVHLKKAEYNAAGLILRNGVKIIGTGLTTTTIRPPVGSTADAVFLLDDGPVGTTRIQDLTINGRSIAGQHGIYLRTQYEGGTDTGTNTGVYDRCELKNLDVRGFAGHCIWLAGGGGDFRRPVQWVQLEQVFVYPSTTGAGLVLSGQIGQCHIIGGAFNGPGVETALSSTGAGRDIWITNQRDEDMVTISATAPYAITMINTSIQSNRRGIQNDNTAALNLFGCHWEDVGFAVIATVGTTNVYGANFQNAGHLADSSGITLSIGSQGRINSFGSQWSGTVDKHYQGSGVRALNDNLGFGNHPITSDVTNQVGVTSNVVDVGPARTSLVNGPAEIRTVKAEAAVGEPIFLKAFGGAITLNWGGTSPNDINASGLSFPHVVPDGAIIQLVRFDLAAHWTVVSLSA